MEYISSLYLPGAIATWCALFFSLAALWGYSLVLRGDESARIFARRAYRFFALSVTLSAVVLAILLFRRDFRIEYVFQYSGTELPMHYQIAAFWAGQKGSFLIWLLWGALIGLPLLHTTGRKQEAPVMGIYTLTLIGLLFILVRENPFVMLPETPTEGNGLNPLLQDDWMVIHPPIMFIGYALSAVPFAFGLAALWRRDFDGWARRAFPWALTGFLVLGSAILMGGYWAYKTLGWGGYWGWDPVENASLIPWLLGVVLIHGLHMERVKGRYRRANFVLATLIYMSVLYGTFLTRSGVLADFSVHSFVDLGITGWLVGLMGVFGAMSIWLLATRLKEVPTQRNEDPIFSRGTFMVLSTIAVAASAIVVTFGTSAPLITRWFMENPAQVGPEFYNRVNFPLAVMVAVLLALVPFLTWRGNSFRDIAKRLIVPAILGVLVAIGGGLAGVHDPMHGAFLFLSTVALTTNFDKTLKRAKVGGLKAAGGYLAHVGVGVILIGFMASSAYDVSNKVTLTQGEPTKVDDLELTFTRFIPRMGEEKERMEVKVVRPDGSSYWSYPKLFVNQRTRQVMANPHIRTTPLQDVYISPIDYDPGEPAGAPKSIQLAEGESQTIGGLSFRFVGFDLNANGNAMAAMAAGQPITVGAAIEVSDGESTRQLKPLYSFTQAGQVQAPPLELGEGAFVRVGAINAADRAIQLDVVGVGAETAGVPPKLSIDVTRKPLIQLVWFGLYVILAGGALATFQRFREARIWDQAQSAKATKPGKKASG